MKYEIHLVQIGEVEVDNALGLHALGVLVVVEPHLPALDLLEYEVQALPLLGLLDPLVEPALHLDGLLQLKPALLPALAQRGINLLRVLDRLGLERVEVSVHFRHGQTERVAQHDVLVLVPASRNNQKLFQPSSTIDYRYESNDL